MPKKNKTKQQDRSIENLKASLKEYNGIVAKMKTIDKVKKAPLRVKKDSVSKMGREEKRVFLRDKVNEAFNADAYEDIDKLIGLTHRSYNQYKALPSTEYNTHQYITEQAIAFLGLDSTIANTLHTYCTYPDESKSDMSDLIFEGHFYGKTSSGVPGNFLVDTFPETTLKAMEFVKKIKYGDDEDIHEHAVMNFTRYYNQFLQADSADQKYFYLGVAAHFLQDLTAPHHTGNYPALPYVDHYFFEKFASQYVYDQPAFKLSQAAYSKFKSKLNSSPTEPESFSLEITGMATPYIKFIESDSHARLAGNERSVRSMDAEIGKLNKILFSGKNEKWEKAIDGAVPLAVYATTYLFETALA
jgi:hypothetical protein